MPMQGRNRQKNNNSLTKSTVWM